MLRTIGLVLLLPFVAAALAVAQDGAREQPKKPYKVGWKIEDEIVLPDLTGTQHDLFGNYDDKVIVLVWWAMRDPAAQKYQERLQGLRKEFAAKDVLFFLVDSSHDELVAGIGDPLKKLRKFKKDEKIPFTILIDRENKIADDFGALTSNHAFVIGLDRIIYYSGGIDDDPKAVRGNKRKNWLRDAIVAVRDGKRPKDMITRPHGRKIKRAPKGAAKDR
ncbi:MAG: redoxin domain-containing protein [Planctomycetota bacterium]|nr:redoxin domain-containing protein [Planctomycetota bacterium]